MPNAVPSCPDHSTPSPQGAPFAGHTVLFDATHGQPNWGETGYSSREMHSNFAGLAQVLCRLGCTCVAMNERPLTKLLGQAKLVLPPRGVTMPARNVGHPIRLRSSARRKSRRCSGFCTLAAGF